MLLIQVLDELTLHAPSGFMKLMRRWPSGPVSLVHLQVLMLLDGDGPLRDAYPGRGARRLPGQRHGIVDRMEQRGLVTRLAMTRIAASSGSLCRTRAARCWSASPPSVASDSRSCSADLTDDELEGFLLGSQALRRARERLVGQLPAAARAFAEGRDGPAATAAQPTGRTWRPPGATRP